MELLKPADRERIAYHEGVHAAEEIVGHERRTGHVELAARENPYLSSGYGQLVRQDISEHTAQQIDQLDEHGLLEVTGLKVERSSDTATLV